MRRQTMLWTACPARYQSGFGTAELSVHVAPRLQSDDAVDTPMASLARFPGMQYWASRASSLTFSAELEQNGLVVTYPCVVVSDAPDAQLWDRLFATTPVRPWSPGTVQAASLPFSDGSRQLRAGVLQAWLQTAADGEPSTPPPLETSAAAYSRLGHGTAASRDGARSLVTQLRSRMRRGGPGVTRVPLSFGNAVDDESIALAAVHFERTLGGTVGPESTALDAGESPRAPLPPDDDAPPVVPTLDFHNAIGMLGSHPILLRRLGLVFDLQVILTPPGGDQASINFLAPFDIRIVPAIAPLAPVSGLSEVHVLNATRTEGPKFSPAPASDSPLSGGFVKVNDPGFLVTGLDVTRSAQRATSFARVSQSQLARRGGAPVPEPLPDGSEPIPEIPDKIDDYDSPPTLTSGGLSLLQADANVAADIRRVRQESLIQDLVGALSFVEPFSFKRPTTELYADDLTRGYRIDVRDVDNDRWHSLHRRLGEYRIGATNPLIVPVTREDDDEGFCISSEIVDDNGDRQISNAIGEWDGWSLSVPRPFKTISPDDRVSDPVAESAANIPLVVGLNKAYGLPMLRFGKRYEMRARTVDLCGNSPVVVGDEEAFVQDLRERGCIAKSEDDSVGRYRRFEPLPPPEVVFATQPLPTETEDLLVVRSERYNEVGSTLSTRHIFPPRTTENFAERHGVFDVMQDGNGGPLPVLPADTSFRRITGYALDAQIPARPTPPLPHEAGKLDQLPGSLATRAGGIYVPQSATARAPWLRDPLVAGVIVRPKTGFLPLLSKRAAEWSALGVPAWPAHLGRLIDGVPVAGALADIQGSGDRWRVLVPPGFRVVVELNSTPGANAANVLAYIAYLDERIALNDTPVPLAHWIRQREAVLAGDHALVSPRRALTVLHAVRTPKAPEWRGDADPLSDGTQLAREREPDETFLQFDARAAYHPHETGKIEVLAKWAEWDDRPGTGAPIRRTFEAVAFEFKPPKPTSDTPFDDEVGVGRAPLSAGQTILLHAHRHDFGDTKHRELEYRLRATSAHVRHFVERKVVSGQRNEPILIDARGIVEDTVEVRPMDPSGVPQEPLGSQVIVNAEDGTIVWPKEVPDETGDLEVTFAAGPVVAVGAKLAQRANSTRTPPAPEIVEILPLFDWQRSAHNGLGTTPTIVSTLNGGWFRVYLGRPWYVTGDDEVLGIVTASNASLNGPAEHRQAGFDKLSRLARDPLFLSSNPSNQYGYFTAADVLNGLPSTDGLAPPASASFAFDDVGATGGIACVPVEFDTTRGLWFADIRINTKSAYWPFLRPSFCRFQGRTIVRPSAGVGRYSPVVLGDWLQLPPKRKTTVTRNINSPFVDISVVGHSMFSSEAGGGPAKEDLHGGPTTMQVIVEKKNLNVSDPLLGWSENSRTTMTTDGALTADGFKWTTRLALPQNNTQYRFVIEESQVLNSDADSAGQNVTIQQGDTVISEQGDPSAAGRRIVFQDIIENRTTLFQTNLPLP